MSHMKKQARMEKFAAGGLIPQPDPQLETYRQALINQMRIASQGFVAPGGGGGGGVVRVVWGTPPQESKFAASEFTMGTAVGVRSWDVDRLGRLVSPAYKTVWSPEEMVATCRAADSFTTFYPKARVEGAEHQQSACSCGFYAYYEGFNEYAEPSRITGVVEGYGETQIGTRGFKSAKARIVALYVPDDAADMKRIGKTPFSLVRENYGQRVAIFDDYSRMADEFPTTQPQDAPTPDTDPDFWTRSI